MRKTRNDYDGPGSFDRVREAAYALADVDTEARGDPEFHRADSRLRAAVKWHTRAILERLTGWQRKGGHARAASLSPERRKEIARKAAQARWDRGPCKQASAPDPEKHDANPGPK